MFWLRYVVFFALLNYYHRTSSSYTYFIDYNLRNDNECIIMRDDLIMLSDLFRSKNNVIKLRIMNNDGKSCKNDFEQFVRDYLQILYKVRETSLIIENYYFNNEVDYDDVDNHDDDDNCKILKLKINNVDEEQQFVTINVTSSHDYWIATKIQNVIIVVTHDERLLTYNNVLFANGSRTTVTIILLANCLCKIKIFEQFLHDLWIKFNALNVWLLTKCTKLILFTYNPFLPLSRKIIEIDLNQLDEIKFDKLINLHRYVLRTSIFVRSPTAMKLNDVPYALKTNPIYSSLSKSFNFGGYDGYVLGNLAEYMNFTLKLTSVSEQSNYGRIVKGGVHKGTLGDVAYKRIDISGNGMFYGDYNDSDDLIEFTIPVNNDMLCVVVPKAQEIPQWIKMFHCFKPKTWIILFLICTICILFWLIVKHDVKRSSSKLVLEIIAIFLTVSISLSTRSYHRIFLAFCMSYTVIITSIFQGSLVKSFSTKSYYDDINTLEDLDQSGLRIGTSLKIFSNSTTLLTSLESKKIWLNISALERAAFYRDVAGVERKQDANLLINTKYKRDDDGYPLLHLMKECPSSVFIAFIVPNGSPYLNRFNYVLYKFTEAGLLEKWYRDVIDAFLWENLKEEKCYFSNEKKPFKFKDVKAAFFLLIFGHIVACLILFIEVRYKK